MKEMTFEQLQQVEGGADLACVTFGVLGGMAIGAEYGALFTPAVGIVASGVFGIVYGVLADC